MKKESERLGIDLYEELGATLNFKAGKPSLKSKEILRAIHEEGDDEKYQEKLAKWDETLSDGITGNKGKVVFENGSKEFIEREHGVSSEYMKGYRRGQEQASQWRAPKTLPQGNGAEAILWLTTDKGFADVSAHCFLKDGSWHWMDTHEVIKRQDFIMGWQPWPKPPTQ